MSHIRINRNIIWLGVFSIAMGFLEAIIVVYLRKIYYPHGFGFPLKMMAFEILAIEWLREIATIVMLAAVSIVAGSGWLQILSYFIYTFGVWDIFYYVGLKLLLNWPASLLKWDVLFLIPVTWLGPVLAPLICSLTMILMALCILHVQARGIAFKVHMAEAILAFLGAFVIFCTFIWDYTRIIFQGGYIKRLFALENDSFFLGLISQHRPAHYNWLLFVLGEIFILCSLASFIVRIRALRNEAGD